MKKFIYSIIIVLLLVCVVSITSYATDEDIEEAVFYSDVAIMVKNMPDDFSIDVLGKVRKINYKDISSKSDEVVADAQNSPLYKYIEDNNIALCVRDQNIKFFWFDEYAENTLYITWSGKQPKEIAVIVQTSDGEITVSDYLEFDNRHRRAFTYDYETNELVLEPLEFKYQESDAWGRAFFLIIIVGLAICEVVLLIIEIIVYLTSKKKITFWRVLLWILINFGVYIGIVGGLILLFLVSCG